LSRREAPESGDVNPPTFVKLFLKKERKERIMAKTIATVLGVVFLLVGIIGFVKPDLLGTHLSLAHNLVHIISGAVALYFGLAGTLSGARLFCLIFGAVYLLLGIVGFVAGGEGTVTAGMPGMSPDPNLFKVLPGTLELGRWDHIVHVLLGIVFLIGGLLTKADVRAAID
jgi:preprotein translocase subunit Sss1